MHTEAWKSYNMVPCSRLYLSRLFCFRYVLWVSYFPKLPSSPCKQVINTLSLSDFEYNTPFNFHFFSYLRSPFIVFTVYFGRTIFLLFPAFESVIHCHIVGLILAANSSLLSVFLAKYACFLVISRQPHSFLWKLTSTCLRILLSRFRIKFCSNIFMEINSKTWLSLAKFSFIVPPPTVNCFLPGWTTWSKLFSLHDVCLFQCVWDGLNIMISFCMLVFSLSLNSRYINSSEIIFPSFWPHDSSFWVSSMSIICRTAGLILNTNSSLP